MHRGRRAVPPPCSSRRSSTRRRRSDRRRPPVRARAACTRRDARRGSCRSPLLAPGERHQAAAHAVRPALELAADGRVAEALALELDKSHILVRRERADDVIAALYHRTLQVMVGPERIRLGRIARQPKAVPAYGLPRAAELRADVVVTDATLAQLRHALEVGIGEPALCHHRSGSPATSCTNANFSTLRRSMRSRW